VSGARVRVRVEIMGSQKYESVGKSQSALIMIDPIISPRTRTYRSSPPACLWGPRRRGPQKSRTCSVTSLRIPALKNVGNSQLTQDDLGSHTVHVTVVVPVAAVDHALLLGATH
jgi:hypothetical protein